MNTYSPAPWKMHNNGERYFITAKDHNGADGVIASCEPEPSEGIDDHANALLMRAAPELLDALKSALNHIRSIPAYEDSIAIYQRHSQSLQFTMG